MRWWENPLLGFGSTVPLIGGFCPSFRAGLRVPSAAPLAPEYTSLDAWFPRACCWWVPPGTGKTLLAHAVLGKGTLFFLQHWMPVNSSSCLRRSYNPRR